MVEITSLLALVGSSLAKKLHHWIEVRMAPQSYAAEQACVPSGNRTQNPRSCSPKQSQLIGSFHYGVVRDVYLGGGVTVVRK